MIVPKKDSKTKSSPIYYLQDMIKADLFMSFSDDESNDIQLRF